MTPHSIDRFYVVAKCILSTEEDIKSKSVTFGMYCSYLGKDKKV